MGRGTRWLPLALAGATLLGEAAFAQSTPVATTPAATTPATAAIATPATATPATATTAGALTISTPFVAPSPAPTSGVVAPPPGQELNIRPAGFSGDPATALGNEQLFRSLTPMQQAWFVRQFHLGRGDGEAAREALSQLVELRGDSGLKNATSFAVALVRESRESVRTGHPEDAVASAQAAAELAPDYPPSHTALARAELANSQFDAAPSAVEAAGRALMRNMRVRIRLLGELGLALLAGGWMAFALFLLLVYPRHLRHLGHDFRHAFADKMPVWLADLILIPFLAFPLVFGVGLLPMLAWLTVALWMQMTVRERWVAALFLLMGTATPFLSRQIGACLAFEGGNESLLYRTINEDEADPYTLDRLAAVSEKDPDILLTLANVHLRAGRYGDAESDYHRAGEAGAPVQSQVGIGVARYGMGDVPGAIAAFDKAVAIDAGSVAAHFNLSQIYAERTELEKSQSNLLAAKEIDARRCDRILQSPKLPLGRKVVEGMPGVVAPAYVNHFLLLDEVSGERLFSRVFAAGAADGMVKQTWRQLSPALSLDATGAVFGAALLLAGGLTLMTRGVVPARACPRCGRGICPRCDGPPLEDDVCVQCYHAFLHTQGTDPQIRAEKSRQVERYHSRLRFSRRFLSVILPGGGLVFAGFTVRGAILLLLASTLATRLLFLRGPFGPLFPDAGVGALVVSGLAGVAFLAVWIWGMTGLSELPERH